jgi:TPR repeat protein
VVLVFPPIPEAVKWFRKAADQGLAPAQYNLGVCYANGEGVPKDVVMAYMWFDLADKAMAKGELATTMSPEEIDKAQRLSREWRALNKAASD